MIDVDAYHALRWAIGGAHGRKATGCSQSGNIDPSYPYGDGPIDGWGYDAAARALHDPDEVDFLSFCSPRG